MKAYSNKTERIKVPFSNAKIKKGDKSAKSAKRKEGKDEIQSNIEQPVVRRRVVEISTCDDCPFINIDDGYDERKWGKTWCDKLDRELKTVEIPDDCPLPFA